MSSVNRSESWTAVALDALWWLRPMAWAAFAFLIWFALFTPAQAECSPNPNGNPGCNGAGNPVDIITGNKYQHEIDLAPLSGEMGLHFSRHYNSNSTHRGLTGVGWRSSFEVVLVDLGSAVQIIDADGRRLTFDRHSNQPSLCVGARPEDGRVIVDEGARESTERRAPSAATKTRRPTYRWQRLDGSEYVFSGGSGDGHPLQSIRAASGATMTLTYLGGALDNVRDAQGRMLRFIYARPVAAGSTRHRMLTLSAIDTPVGRVTYRHDEFGRLQAAIQPNGLVHRYHYEPERQGASHNTWALTGISVEWVQDGKISTERLATYVYDAQGRAVRTQHAGADDLTLAYGPKAATTITTALGARTVYRHALVAGQWKTVEAIGPGCVTCPPANVRYRYRIDGPQAGQLEATLRLDEQGKPLQQERVTFDAWGRPTHVERISYMGDRASKQTQKPELVLRARYEAMPQNLQSAELSAAQYAALWRPTLVARPSVVPGREHTVAFTYNAHLQPVTKTETGASPLDGAGNLVPTGLTRTTSYRYAQIAGVSRLTAIDGSLPGRADTTTLHYDELGSLRLVQHPVPDLQERFAYDEAGRIIWHTPVDAVAVRTRYPDTAHTLATQPALPAEVGRAGRTASFEFNPRGWVVAWKDGTRAITLAYNGEGRVIEARDAQGNRVTWSRDEAKRLEATLWFDTSQVNTVTPSPQRSYYRWLDQADRTVKTLTADDRIDEYVYDAQGRLTQHLDSDGIAHLYRARRDAEGGNTQARIDLTPHDGLRVFMSRQTRQETGDRAVTSSTPSTKPAHRRLRDDFGRIVRVDFPEHGTRLLQYDEADRIQQVVFADGAKVESKYDASSRMVERVVRSPDGDLESVTTLRYYGAYLTEVVDPVQTTAYQYDDAGRRVETRITLAGPGGVASAQVHTIGTVFDAQGQPIEHRLADGRTMTVERDAATQLPSALMLKARGLQRAQPILSGIRAHPFNGITNFINGNGLATERRYDSAGRLTALVTNGVLDFRYDYTVGPRIRSIRNGADAKHPQTAVAMLDYDGFGALVQKTSTGEIRRASMAGAGLVRASLGDIPSAENVRRDLRGRLIADDQHLYHYDALDRLVAVQDRAEGKLIGRYTYNAFGERVSKTTTDGQGRHVTRQFLYQRSKLVAEIVSDEDGTSRVERQYIYLNAQPVALLEADRVLAIHADHRGAPVALTDAEQRVVWLATYRDAWGEVQAVEAPTVAVAHWKALLNKASAGRLGEISHGAMQMNLRLPGQYADQETGLHYNMHRYYDPRGSADNAKSGVQRTAFGGKEVHGQGRYLTPDPMGYPDGPDPYLYADGDPINKIDPLGLYNADVHYYMTFFLAIAAGMRAEDARTMALATQFIDDNDATQPLTASGGLAAHKIRLLRYHFVLTDPRTEQLYAGVNHAGLTAALAGNPQLQALYGYAAPTPEPGSCNFPNNQSLQFMGEYLHAFEDTFSHRDRFNLPFDVNNGLGHAHENHDPDYTFNHRDNLGRNWSLNENRTYVMEEQVYGRITRYMTEMNFFVSGRHSGRVVSFNQLQTVLQRFNANRTKDLSGDAFNAKIAVLNDALVGLGFTGIDMTVGGAYGYDRATAEANRRRNFAGLNSGDFLNAILETR